MEAFKAGSEAALEVHPLAELEDPVDAEGAVAVEDLAAVVDEEVRVAAVVARTETRSGCP